MSGPYSRLWWHGELFNRRTVNMLQAAEQRYGGSFIYYQGSYSSSVSASAGTHDGGGAVDLWCSRPDDAVRALRNVGFAAWNRTGRGDWTPHIHAIAIGDKQMSSGARAQVQDYFNGRDGLAGHGPDYHWRPNPIKVWGKNVGPGTSDEPKKVNWFVIKRQLQARTPTHKWAVRVLQRELNKQGFHLVIDGNAGPKTRSAFRKYRERHRLGPFEAARKLLLPKYRATRNK